MGKWRNKGEAQPAPAPQKKGKRNPEMRAFNQRLFDPVNATIDHADKLEMQSLARAAQSGDNDAINAYRMKLMGSGLTQGEKDALGQMFMPKPQKSGRGSKIKATLPNEGVESAGGRWRKYPQEPREGRSNQPLVDPVDPTFSAGPIVGIGGQVIPGKGKEALPLPIGRVSHDPFGSSKGTPKGEIRGRGGWREEGGPMSGPDFQNEIYKEKLWEDRNSDFYKAVKDRYYKDMGPNRYETMDLGFDPASGFQGSGTFLSWLKRQPEYEQHVNNRINSGRYNPDSPYNDPFWGMNDPMYGLSHYGTIPFPSSANLK